MKLFFLCSISYCLSVFTSLAALTISEQATLPAGVAQNTEGASSSSVVASGNTKGQGVNFLRGVHLTGFVVKLASVSTTSDITVSIYATSGGLPTGAALFTDSGTLPGTLAGGDFVQFDFASTVDLAAGNYAVVLQTTGSNISLRLNTDNDYTGGVLVKNQGAGWAANTGSDCVFFYAWNHGPTQHTNHYGGACFSCIDGVGKYRWHHR